MKRSVWAGIISATAYAALAASSASCNWMPDDKGDIARLTFHFAGTKADALPDTNQFILTVCRGDTGEPVFEGRYGSRPAELQVPSGTYTVSVFSERFTAPAFEAPLYGDEKVVVARSGETVAVDFLCRLRNSGIRLDFSDRFKAAYPGKIVIRQVEGALDYGYAESRTAYVFPGETRFAYHDGTAENILFRRTLEAGEIRSLSIDATDTQAGSTFSIALDTTVLRRWEKVVVGEENGGDGLSMATAYSVPDFLAADCAGDTVWVWGYVVGTIEGEQEVRFACDTASAGNNLAIAPTVDSRESASCAGVYLSKAAQKNVLNLKDPDNRERVFHHKIYLQGKAYTYKKFAALTNLCDYKLE